MAKEKKPSLKAFPVSGSITGAVESFKSIMEELRDECKEVVDNAEGGLAETSRIQTLTETVETLDNIADADDVEIPEDAGETVVYYTENRRKGQSRSDRRFSALSALESAIDGLNNWVENNSDNEKASEVQDAISTLEEWQSHAENAEFPGRNG